MSDSPASPRPGGEVGRFELREKLQGGNPRIYRAYDVLYGREVRLKLYWGCDASLPLLIETHRAAREVRHPAIVPVYDIGTAGDHCFVAGGAAHGRRLSDELADGPLAHRRAAVVARELAEGLGRAHERGVVHGDIHPSGVILDPENGAGWLDLGVSADAAPSNPAYAAPERLGDPPGPADTASDEYALGVLLFEMLTGRTPHAGDDEEVTAAALSADTAPSPRARDGDIPKNLDAICRKAIAPDPADRYSTCQDFADDLRRWLEGESVAARPPKRWLVGGLIGLLALTACAVGAGGLLILFQTQRAMVAEQQAMRAEAMARERAESARAAADQSQGKAEASLAEIEQRKKEDAAARKKLEDELSKVREAERKLLAEKNKLEGQKKGAVEAREKAEQMLYCRDIVESHSRWRNRDTYSALSLHRALKPADQKQTDHREWEWHFLDRLYQPPKTFTHKLGNARLVNPAPGGDAPRTARGAVTARFSPDGTSLAICVLDDQVTIWNRVSASTTQTLEGHKGAVCGVAYSPDGALIATSGVDRTVKVWEPATGQLRASFRGHGDVVGDVAFGRDGKTVVAGCDDKIVSVWDIASEERVHKLEGHTAPVTNVAAASGSDLIASAASDGVVNVWNAKSGESRHTIRAHVGPITSITFSPDGSRLATAGVDRTVRLWDPATGKEARTLLGHARPVSSLSFRGDGQRLASTGEDTTVCLWNLESGDLMSFRTGHDYTVGGVSYRPDGRQLATASPDRTVKLWDADRPVPPVERTIQGDAGAIHAMALSGSKFLAIAGADKVVRLLDPQTGNPIRTLEGAGGPVRSLAFTEDGTSIVVGSDDKSARVYDTATGQLQRTVAHSAAVHAVAVSVDGKKLAIGGGDGITRIREFATGQSILTLTNDGKVVTKVAFSREGNRIVTAGAQGFVRIYDARTGDRIEMTGGLRSSPSRPAAGAIFNQYFNFAAAIAFNRSGRRLACARGTGDIIVLDTNSLLMLKPLEGHDAQVNALAFSPNGRRLASAAADGTVKLWDALTGLEVLQIAAHRGPVTGLDWTGDGKSLITSGEDKLVKVWDGSPLDPIVKALDDAEKDDP